MKALFLILMISSITLSAQAKNLFVHLDDFIQIMPSQPEIITGHRILSLYARLSFYALSCGTTEDNVKFSNLYRSQFTELSQGRVSFRSQTFANPIEYMRNRAGAEFYRSENEVGGRQILCEENRAEFDRLVNLTPEETDAFVRDAAE